VNLVHLILAEVLQDLPLFDLTPLTEFFLLILLLRGRLTALCCLLVINSFDEAIDSFGVLNQGCWWVQLAEVQLLEAGTFEGEVNKVGVVGRLNGTEIRIEVCWFQHWGSLGALRSFGSRL
jgi:hypothetical protein